MSGTTTTDRPRAGELLHDAAYALAFRTLEPVPERPRHLLVLLHGVGGDEFQLEPLGRRVGGDTVVVLPRGPRSIRGGMLGWYRVGLSGDGPQVVLEEAEEAREKLLAFLGQLQSRHDLAPRQTTVAGFSQGGILAASAALTSPASVAGFAVLAGRILPEIEPMLPDPPALAHLRALLVHGRHDGTLEPGWVERAGALLDGLGIPHRTRMHDAGHELTPAMEDDLLDWLADPGARMAGARAVAGAAPLSR